MIVVVTGADGFIGRNLLLHLSERKGAQVRCFGRGQRTDELESMVAGADVVFHLAGVNRPTDTEEFVRSNVDLTRALCGALANEAGRTGKRPCVIYTSSIQVDLDNPYGRSKSDAERLLLAAEAAGTFVVRILRLPNVFGKWARPNYNSVVATFCHNVTRELPIEIHDPSATLRLVHVDDVIDRFLGIVDGDLGADAYVTVAPQYQTTVGEVADLIRAFHRSRVTLVSERVGTGLARALYSTYVSYLPPERFCYEVPMHGDARGVFVEMLKTRDSGQVSYFTAHPGVTRGGHYHHSKTEKFLVIKGEARYRFRQVQTGETYELYTSGVRPVIVETVPGWTHDITNVGGEEMVVMLWANEVFDRDRPDTYASHL